MHGCRRRLAALSEDAEHKVGNTVTRGVTSPSPAPAYSAEFVRGQVHPVQVSSCTGSAAVVTVDMLQRHLERMFTHNGQLCAQHAQLSQAGTVLGDRGFMYYAGLKTTTAQCSVKQRCSVAGCCHYVWVAATVAEFRRASVKHQPIGVRLLLSSGS